MQSANNLGKLRAAFCRMARSRSGTQDLGDLSLTLRTALNMTFIGTDDAAHAARFVEKHIPYGKPLSEKSRAEIRHVIGRLKAQKSPVFSRERLMDDMGL